MSPANIIDAIKGHAGMTPDMFVFAGDTAPTGRHLLPVELDQLKQDFRRLRVSFTATEEGYQKSSAKRFEDMFQHPPSGFLTAVQVVSLTNGNPIISDSFFTVVHAPGVTWRGHPGCDTSGYDAGNRRSSAFSCRPSPVTQSVRIRVHSWSPVPW